MFLEGNRGKCKWERDSSATIVQKQIKMLNKNIASVDHRKV